MELATGRQGPDPWDDPEFSPARRPAKNERPRPGLGGRTWILLLVLVALWLGLMLDPMLGPLVLGAMSGLLLTLCVIAATMALGVLGSGLFAVGDRLLAWLHHGSRWPDE